MKPLLKWPGGKAREIAQVYGMIPEHKRYIEPFFGGGAMYFHLKPEQAAINDVCRDLMDFYRLLQVRDEDLLDCLNAYAVSFQGLLELCRGWVTKLLDVLALLDAGAQDARAALNDLLDSWMDEILRRFPPCLRPEPDDFRRELEKNVWDKLQRTARNHQKRPFPPEDLAENLVTGFTSGYYMYFRRIYNQWTLGQRTFSPGYQAANFFFIRETCYGSMFRYNAKGEFNIPYGGMSYNRKDFAGKVQALFRPEVAELLSGTSICCKDFEAFLQEVQPTQDDFLFLDPPYDTEFSDYEGEAFTRLDQARLALTLSRTKAKFLLIIKDTPYISGLYSQGFHVQRFDKQYTYNVRSRNDRKAEHLIVTNYPV